MEFILSNILTLILFTPVLAAVIIMILPHEQEDLIRWVAFVLSFIPLLLSIMLWLNFDPGTSRVSNLSRRSIWYPPINSSFHVGVDGISLTMVLLTTLLDPAGDPGFVLNQRSSEDLTWSCSSCWRWACWAFL